MLNKDPIGGSPTNTTLWKLINENQHELNFIASMLANLSFIKLHLGNPKRATILMYPIEIDLDDYSREIGLDTKTSPDWGSISDGTDVLAYAICRLILGKHEYAKSLYKDYVIHLERLSPIDDHRLSVADIKQQIEQLIAAKDRRQQPPKTPK